jgi:hypothetical protein
MLCLAAFAVMTVNPEVKIVSNSPDFVNPGDEFMVRISIDKGSLSKGATLQQILPVGFTASPIENENAQFYFENQMLRYVWGNLPDKSTLVIAYKIRVQENATGLKKLGGIFIYEQKNGTTQLDLPSELILVSNEFPVTNAGTAVNEQTGKMSVKKSISVKPGISGETLRMTLLVSRNSERGSASWTGNIPEGYTVEVNQAEGAEFSVSPAGVHFVWKNMPEAETWSFSYTLIPPSGARLIADADLHGIMVYGSDEKILTCIASPDGQMNNRRENYASSTLMKESIDEKHSVRHAEPLEETGPVVNRGAYYKVQIAATRHSPVRNTSYFQKTYKISFPVDMSEHEGWRKYCIGTFSRYEPAKSLANETNSIMPGAFVVAYRDGQRIPVAELMESLAMSQ